MAKHGKQHQPRNSEAVIGEGWEGGTQAVFLGLRAWRALHPQATLREIEAELDQRLSRLRAQMLEDLALASAAADLACQDAEPPRCPQCGGRLHDAGMRERTLVTVGNEAVHLRRDYATCSQCGSRLFPPRR